jgi:hypothetical protein
MRRDWPGLLLIVLLPLADLCWNLTHLNIGLVDFYGLSAFAQGCAIHGAWPATPYFPAGYPLLLIPFGYLGSTLVGGYILSALGIMLALYASWMLLWSMGADRPAGAAAVLLCWLAPVCRVVAGSPSVDALYTGLGMWFVASAIIVWRIAPQPRPAGQGGLPRWALLGLLLPALMLPLLRYHALILLVPVLIVLALGRRNLRPVCLSLITAGLAVAFNYGAYYVSYHKAVPSVAAIQVLTGLELKYHLLYPAGSDALWADYTAFCQRARHTSVFSVFTPYELVNNWQQNWGKFLRQPSVFVLCLLLAGMCISRRQLPRGALLGLMWVAAYTLVLAVTYYTARAALLPVLLATALCIATAQNTTAPGKQWLTGLTAVLLLAGFGFASRFSISDFHERRLWADNSRVLARELEIRQVSHTDVAASDWRLLPLHNNSWTSPYAEFSSSWIDDPEIPPIQRTAIRTIAGTDQALEPPPVHYIAVYADDSTADPSASLASWLKRTAHWKKTGQVTMTSRASINLYEYDN